MKSIFILISLIVCKSNAAGSDFCSQAREMSLQLNECNQQLSTLESELSKLRNQGDELTRALNDPSNSYALRQCQDSNRVLEHELRASSMDFRESEQHVRMLQERERDLWRFLERSTDSWECVLMDKKYAGTRLFTGRTEEDAVSQWKFSDHREMFRKHDFYKFCNRVYRDNNERFPDDDVQPPPPGRDERDGRDGRPPGRG